MAKVAAEVSSTANHYQILAKLAVGDMAEKFLARSTGVSGVDRYCVLSRVLRERDSDADFVQMFVQDALLAAQLQHPNIASVYDVGMLGDSFFFAMEYVHGETMGAILECAQRLRRPVPLACALTIVAGAAAGLHHAHERRSRDFGPLRIVHRNVSPSSVMVSFEGNVKLVDFGFTWVASRAMETEPGSYTGKPGYLSPEQLLGERVDRRSDLFMLGIVMWETLTGERLYRRASLSDMINAIVNEPPPTPSSYRRDIPRAIDDIVLRLLTKDVGARFQTAAAVLEAIEDASMRADMLLSTSALSRLVRDLFGVRPEPWLELARNTLPNAPGTLTSRPVSRDGGIEPARGAADRGSGPWFALDQSAGTHPAPFARKPSDLGTFGFDEHGELMIPFVPKSDTDKAEAPEAHSPQPGAMLEMEPGWPGTMGPWSAELLLKILADWREPGPVLRVVEKLARVAAVGVHEVSLDEIAQMSEASDLRESIKIAEYLSSERAGLLVAQFKLKRPGRLEDLSDQVVHVAFRTGILCDPQTSELIDDWPSRVVWSYRTSPKFHQRGV